MNPWLGLDRLLFWLARQFLTLWTRANTHPADLEELGLDPSVPVVYVLRDASLADLLMLDREVQRLNLPSPLSALSLDELNLSRRYSYIYRRRLFGARERVSATSTRMEKLVDYLHRHEDADIQLVPVSLFWGRAPEKQNSLWKIIFSDNWSAPGFIRKFFIILTQGRQLLMRFSRPLSMRQLVDRDQSASRTLRKTLRVLRVHFRRQHEAVIGPDLSHRRLLASTLVKAPAVQQVILRNAREAGKPPEKVEAKARKYALEIAADYSHTVIRFLEVLLGWVWNRLYDGLRVYNMDKLRAVAGDHEIIYVPCHRSHIDYLLLSYLVYTHGLVPPHIAAGINLNMPVVGPILRRGGAFFMRRSFRNNPLYAAIFSEYMHTIIARGFSIEYFVEGGRSRSGRMLTPRTGMLSMTMKSFLRDASKPIAFVPVYVGYEKVIESRSYIGELYGGKKEKESVGGLVKSLKFLRSHFGQVHVNFGDPIILHDFLDQQAPGWRRDAGAEEQPQWMRESVNVLAEKVVTGINAAAVANPINLISLALLATPKHVMDIAQLRKQLELYITLLGQAPYSDNAALAEANPDAIIEYGLKHGFISRIEHPLGDLVTTDAVGALQMAYVRNNSLHLFVLPGLICSLFLNARSIRLQQVQRLVKLLYPFLRNEYYLHWQDDKELDAVIERILDVLVDQGLIAREDDRLTGAPIHSAESDLLAHLGQTVMQSLERFYLTIRILVQYGDGRLKAADLEDMAHRTAQRLSLLYEFNSPEFFDKTVLRNFITQLNRFGLTETDEQGHLRFNGKLTDLDDEARRILSPHISQAIQRVTRRQQ
jgi:glycerol-3-phosphate O-acyltransferase